MSTNSVQENNASLRTMTVDALSFCARQDQTLSTRIKPLADAILSAENPVDSMTQVFQAARGESVAAKLSNAKDRARALGKAWNRLNDGLNGHFANADMVGSWPNFASGKGECSLVTAEVSKAVKKQAKLDREESDAQALAAFQLERQQAEIEAIRAMSSDEIQSAIENMLHTWCQGDVTAAAAVAFAVADNFAVHVDMHNKVNQAA
jgi:hypothetical protein